MKAKKNLHQQAAALSQAKILKEARKLFLKNGFAGTSISAIAQASQIPQSLLYHYFQNKEDLWRQVKADIISSSERVHVEVESLDDLLNQLVSERFQLHTSNPDLMHLLMWQILENNQSSLSGTATNWMSSWLKTIEKLQNQGLVNKQFTAEEIMFMLNGAVWSPFLSAASTEQGELYCKKMVSVLKQILS